MVSASDLAEAQALGFEDMHPRKEKRRPKAKKEDPRSELKRLRNDVKRKQRATLSANRDSKRSGMVNDVNDVNGVEEETIDDMLILSFQLDVDNQPDDVSDWVPHSGEGRCRSCGFPADHCLCVACP